MKTRIKEILVVFGVIVTVVACVDILGHFPKAEIGDPNDKDYFVPEAQVSDCDLSGEDFIEVLCKENSIDVNGFYRIECPRCPSGNWYSGISYNKVEFGAYVERSPDGTEMCLFYGVGEGINDIPAGTYCGQCGYQIGSDWTIVVWN